MSTKKFEFGGIAKKKKVSEKKKKEEDELMIGTCGQGRMEEGIEVRKSLIGQQQSKLSVKKLREYYD